MRLGLPAPDRASKAAGGQARARSRRRLGPAGRGALRCSRPEGGSAPRPRMAGTMLRIAPMLGARHARRRAALWRVAMPLGGLRCSAPSMRAPACPPAALRASPGGMPIERLGAIGKAVGGCAAARLMRRRGAQESWPRAQRASSSDSSRLFEHSERSERQRVSRRATSPSTAGDPARSGGRRITSAAAYPPAALLALPSQVATPNQEIVREFPSSQGLHRRRIRASDAQGARQDRRAAARRVCAPARWPTPG